MNCATITNENSYSIFQYGNTVIKFKAPYSLEYYDAIKEWDDGYIVLMAKYRHNTELEEEYIDLKPILDNLYIDAEEFLRPIKEVVVKSNSDVKKLSGN